MEKKIKIILDYMMKKLILMMMKAVITMKKIICLKI